MELSVYSDEHFMREAYKEALLAEEEKEIPVGAVLVCNKRIVARAHNQTETLNDVTAHAEMLALTAGFNHLGAKYLKDCTLYVTLEPCAMCAGAIFWSQLGALKFAAADVLRGYRTVNAQMLHPKTKVEEGLMREACEELISNFFKNLRKRN